MFVHPLPLLRVRLHWLDIAMFAAPEHAPELFLFDPETCVMVRRLGSQCAGLAVAWCKRNDQHPTAALSAGRLAQDVPLYAVQLPPSPIGLIGLAGLVGVLVHYARSTAAQISPLNFIPNVHDHVPRSWKI